MMTVLVAEWAHPAGTRRWRIATGSFGSERPRQGGPENPQAGVFPLGARRRKDYGPCGRSSISAHPLGVFTSMRVPKPAIQARGGMRRAGPASTWWTEFGLARDGFPPPCGIDAAAS